MLGSRRRWLAISASAAGVFAAHPFLLLGQRSPQPIPSPHAPNPNYPPGLDGPDIKPGTDNKSAIRKFKGKSEAMFSSSMSWRLN